MIVSLHVATGAAGGALVASRRAALPLGLVLHLVGDVMPHQDIPNRRFEVVSGVACLALIAARRGVLSPALLGAAAASAPDLEHVTRRIRFRRRKVFPSHRWRGLHQSGGAPSVAQLLAAGVLVGLVVSARRR